MFNGSRLLTHTSGQTDEPLPGSKSLRTNFEFPSVQQMKRSQARVKYTSPELKNGLHLCQVRRMYYNRFRVCDGSIGMRGIDRLFISLRNVFVPLLVAAVLADSFAILLDHPKHRRSILLQSTNNPIEFSDDGSLISRDTSSATNGTVSSSYSAAKGNSLMNAFASATKRSCSILGVKSIGVDYGLVRTGVAVTVGYNPEPLEILSDLNSTQVAERVVQICQSEKANQIIVGLPLHKNGTEAEQTNITRQFASELALHTILTLGPSVPIYLWDERYTSKEAAARAHAHNPNRELYGQLDAEAACIILENFYQENGLDPEQVEPPADVKERMVQLWKDRQAEEEANLKSEQESRDARLRWRREAMLRDRQLELENTNNCIDDQNSGSSKKGKKKKKQKKKREKRGSWIVLSVLL